MRGAAFGLMGLSLASGAQAQTSVEVVVGSAQIPSLAGPLKNVRLRCAPLRATPEALLCEGGSASLEVPKAGTYRGPMRGRFASFETWDLTIGPIALGSGTLSFDLRGASPTTHVKANARRVPLPRLRTLARALGLGVTLEGQGGVSGTVDGSFTAAGWQARFDLETGALTMSSKNGRYASEALAVRTQGQVSGAGKAVRGTVEALLSKGQLYIEPVFMDLAKHPLDVRASLSWLAPRLSVTTFSANHKGVGRASGSLSATLGAKPRVESMKLSIKDAALAGSIETYLQPYLVGTKFEDLTGSGRSEGEIELKAGAVTRVAIDVAGGMLDLPRLGSDLKDVSGSVRWNAGRDEPSKLSWSSGRVRRVPIGASSVEFVTRARDFRLTAPWRQPILDGALLVRRLKLTRIGQPELGADVDAEVLPIDVAALTEALGWPRFAGHLSGRIPGMKVQERVLTMEGALQAQVFDGAVEITDLRMLEPWSALPRLTANVRLRGLDLLQLTGAFSFGRIEGRLDGDIEGLRLLRWEPVAFKARFNTPPDDDSRHRISQRAVENISSIGGGPRGALSRGFLGLFKEFNYDRIGLSCVLENGVCDMNGIEPAENGGYVLVKGRGLPRIDVVGFTRRVDWARLVEQLRAVKDSEPTTVKPE